MSFSDLFNSVQDSKPKISRNTIRKEVLRITGKKSVTHIRASLDTEICRGFYLSSRNKEQRLVQQTGTTVIVTARSLNSCWERFVFVKELMHLFEDPKGNTDNGAKFDTLLNEFSQPSQTPSPAMMSELECFWRVISVLCPQKVRFELKDRLENKSIDPLGIATYLKIPAVYVPRLFDARYDDFLKQNGLS